MSDFRVQGQLSLDGTGFFSTLGKASGAVGKFGGLLAGAFSVGAVTAFSRSILDLAGRLRQVSEALNINVEFLQRFTNSTATSGGSLDDVEKFIVASNKARQEAADNPSGSQAQAFDRLGFSPDEVATLTAQQFMERMIEAFKDGADTGTVTALVDIGGKSAKNLIGGFKAGLDNTTEIMTEDTVNALEEIGSKFTRIWTTLKVLFAPLLLALAKDIEKTVNELVRLKAFWTAFFKGMIRGDGFKKSRQAGLDIADEIFDDQKLRQIADERARRAAQEARRRAQEAPTSFAPAPEDKARPQRHAAATMALYTDALLTVGNFLGAGKSSMQSVAERHLEISKQILGGWKDILSIVQRTGVAGSFNLF